MRAASEKNAAQTTAIMASLHDKMRAELTLLRREREDSRSRHI